MGYAISPKTGPGRFDICPSCQHRDCAYLRRLVVSECIHCHKPIGEGAAYYSVPPRGYAHAACEQEAAEFAFVEQQRAADDADEIRGGGYR